MGGEQEILRNPSPDPERNRKPTFGGTGLIQQKKRRVGPSWLKTGKGRHAVLETLLSQARRRPYYGGEERGRASI